MRLAPPQPFRKSSQELLSDVFARLSEKYPGLEASPTDPGWLMLEQAAWLVEGLTEQMDDYPLALMQSFLRLAGAKIEPAQPSLVAVCVDVSGTQEIDPGVVRFFSQQDETLPSVEFAPAERVVLAALVPQSVVGFSDGELYTSEQDLSAGHTVALRRDQPSRAFDGQRVVLVVAPHGENFAERLRAAVATVEAGPAGWLRFEVSEAGKGALRVVAHIDPGNAFDAPGGITTGGVTSARWGFLPESGWRPPVYIASRDGIPVEDWGADPLPGLAATGVKLEMLDVEAGIPVEDLLVLEAVPIPLEACAAVWRAIVAVDSSLEGATPSIQRRFSPPVDGAPAWLQVVLDKGGWSDISGRDNLVVHVGIAGFATTARFGLVTPIGERRDVRVLGVSAAGQLRPLGAAPGWRVGLVDADAAVGLMEVSSFDVALEPDILSLLVEVADQGGSLLINPLLCIQAPVVRDGREVTVEREVPEAVSLLNDAVVDAEVIDRVTSAVNPAGGAILAALDLASFTHVSNGKIRSIENYAGMTMDAGTGTLTLNAPDRHGQRTAFRRGDVVGLEWYRRTDGEVGNVAAGSITLVEGAPLVVSVTNPLGAFHGKALESDEAATKRLFGNGDGIPVLPADFEREIRNALGSAGSSWFVRVWTHAERTLLNTDIWPPVSVGKARPLQSAAFETALRGAGPETLCVVLGPTDRQITAAELVDAAQKVENVRVRISKRFAPFRKTIVGAFFPLEGDGVVSAALPAVNPGTVGTVSDSHGHSTRARGKTFLNAAIVRVKK